MSNSAFPAAFDNLVTGIAGSQRNAPSLADVINKIQQAIGTTGAHQFLQASGATATAFQYTGNPNSHVAALAAGDLCIDSSTPAIWQATASGNSHWVLVQGSVGYFDIRNYGAKVDGSTDDTAAVQAALTAAVNAGGGDIFFPPGICQMTAAQQTQVNAGYTASGQLLVPNINESGGMITIRFLGAVPCVQSLWNAQSATVPPPTSVPGASIIRSTASSGNILDVVKAANTWMGDFSAVMLTFENLLILAPNNPACGGLHCQYAAGAGVRSCFVGVNAAPNAITNPTNGTTAVTLPENNNACYSEVRSSQIYGFATGLQHSEHTVLDNAGFDACGVGVQVNFGSHLSRYYRLLIQRCTRGIYAFDQGFIEGTVAFEAHAVNNVPYHFDIDDYPGHLHGKLGFMRYGTNGALTDRLYAFGGGNLGFYNLDTTATLGHGPDGAHPFDTTDNFGDNGGTAGGNSYALGTMTSGQVWQQYYNIPPTFSVGASNAGASPIASNYGQPIFAWCPVYHPTLNTANYNVTVNVKTSSGTSDIGALLQYIDHNNFICCRVQDVSGTNQLKLSKFVGGTETTLATAMAAGITASTSYAIVCNVVPGTITVKVNGTTQITYSKTGGEQTLFNPSDTAGIIFNSTATTNQGEDGGSLFTGFSVV